MSPMLYTKIQPKNFLVLEKKIFKCFYYLWTYPVLWCRTNSIDDNTASTKGPMWNLVKTSIDFRKEAFQVKRSTICILNTYALITTGK